MPHHTDWGGHAGDLRDGALLGTIFAVLRVQMDEKPHVNDMTEAKPTPFELANLAAILLAGQRPGNNLEEILGDAMKLYEAAERKIARMPFTEVQYVKQIHAELLSKEPRYWFAPHRTTDEAREYLKMPDVGLGLSALRNVTKGKTLETKLRTYYADVRIVRRTPKENSGEIEPAAFRERGWHDEKPAYAIMKCELDRFRRWQLEVARIEALNRKRITPAPLEIWARLLAVSQPLYIDAEAQKYLILNEIDPTTADDLSRQIVGELRSLTLMKKRNMR